MRFPKTLRSSQKGSGRLPSDPTAFDRAALRPAETRRLSRITSETARLNPSPMAKHFTNFAPKMGGTKVPKVIGNARIERSVPEE